MKAKSTSFTPLASRACIATAALAVILCQPALFATPLYWDGNGVTAGAGNTTALLNKVWGTDSMWNSDPLGVTDTFTPTTASGDDLFFVAAPSATSGQIAFNPTVTDTQAANSITFQSQGAQTLSGGTAINLGAGGLTGSQFAYDSVNRGTVTISSPISLTASQSWINNATNAMTVSGAISGTGNLIIQNSSTGTFTVSTGGINHAGTITNSGSGGATTTISGVVGSAVTGITQNSATSLLVLSAANTAYAGTTTLTSGTLRGSNPGTLDVFSALGTGPINMTAGTLQLKANGSGNGGKTIASTNSLTTGSNPVTVDVDRNSTNSNNNITLASLTLGSGQLNVTGANGYTFRISGATTIASNVTVNPTTGSLTLVGAIGGGSNNYSFTKIGSGILTLAGASTYDGTTSILAGTVNLAAAATSGSPGTLGNATSAVLLGDTTGSSNVTLQSSLGNVTTMERNMIVQSGNTGLVSILGNPGSSFITHTISGNIQLGTASGTGHGVTLGAAVSSNTANYTGIISDPPSLSGPAAPVTVGSGNARLAGTNTFAGGLIINGGGVRLHNNDGAGTGTITINGGSLAGPGYNQGPANITFANNQIWNASFSSGTAAGTGGFTSTGSISLTADITLTMENVGYTSTGVISDSVPGANHSLTLKNNGTNGGASWSLSGANTFGGGVLVIGNATNGTSQTATLNAGGASGTALGTGQATLSNTAFSVVNISTNQTIDSLSSAINHPKFTAGTGGTPGTQALVFTGGGGTGAAGTATISAGGAITGISITSYGQNYTSAPTISLSTPGGDGTITSSFGSSSIALGSRTLTLAGTNASPATYAGIISGANGSLVKNGTGTQILTGANTYTGATTIAGGTLKLGTGGALAAGTNVSIAAGGTFDVTDLTISSGTYSWNMASLSASGTATAATITGTAGGTVDLGIKPITLTYNGSNPSLTGSGAALSLGGNQITVVVPGTALGAGVYTLVSAGSITGSVDPTPLYTGGNGVAIGATGVVSISGNSLVLTVSGGGGSNYASWATDNGIPGEPASGDFDNDGLSNFVEYALDKDPTVSSHPAGTFAGGILTFTKGSDAIANNDVIFEIEESTDLGISDPWTTVVTEGTADDTPDISYPLPSGETRIFARLKVTQIP